MTDITLRADQIYVACNPRDEGRRIRIKSYTLGHSHAHVVDANTGKRPRWIAATQLHASSTALNGRPRRSGYALVIGDETSGRALDGTETERTEIAWYVQELFPSGWGNVEERSDRASALAVKAGLQERNAGTEFRLVRRTITLTVEAEGDR
ncbi:hypothetical protein [Streptomyces abikoensis]|uniref:hypothetical protein n=1 Tax=Streptomyces abikoensis TaxID=97398 RepID=UPI00167C2B19|nr:hypothetical protein [Streptomyces abikoensis]GGP55717.1 hypothetical protein GCM10010214_31140 [Streptomyces abikoensis]